GQGPRRPLHQDRTRQVRLPPALNNQALNNQARAKGPQAPWRQPSAAGSAKTPSKIALVHFRLRLPSAFRAATGPLDTEPIPASVATLSMRCWLNDCALSMSHKVTPL